MTVLCLYVRVQVNILGRQLYVEIARDSENSEALVGAFFLCLEVQKAHLQCIRMYLCRYTEYVGLCLF